MDFNATKDISSSVKYLSDDVYYTLVAYIINEIFIKNRHLLTKLQLQLSIKNMSRSVYPTS